MHLIPCQALCFQDPVPFLLSALQEILGPQKPSEDSKLNLVVQRESPFFRALEHGLAIALDLEHAIAPFDQRNVML